MKLHAKMLTLGAAAIVASAIGWNALAETPSQGGRGGPAMHATGSAGTGPGMMGSAFADPTSDLASIKQQLGITEKQGAAWDAYTKAVGDSAASLQAAMTQIHDQHRQAFQTLRTAADQLVAALDDTQKQKAQEVLPGLGSHGHPMMGPTRMMGMGGMR
jgi:hypothetical protein